MCYTLLLTLVLSKLVSIYMNHDTFVLYKLKKYEDTLVKRTVSWSRVLSVRYVLSTIFHSNFKNFEKNEFIQLFSSKNTTFLMLRTFPKT